MGRKGIYQINLAELIEDYTWKCFKRDQGCFKRLFLRRSDYQFYIRWGYIDFKHVTNPGEKKPKVGQSTLEPVPDDQQETAIDAEMRCMTQKVEKANKKDVELYFSEYENKTSESQKYTFTATRQTTATTRVEMQENYTLGAKTNLEVNFAEIFKLGAELSASYSVTETEAEEFSKTLTWDINTEILVPSWNKAKASLYVYEMPLKSDFVVKTTISLPSGSLPVSIRKVKDGKEVHTEWICRLDALFVDDYKEKIEVVPRTYMDHGIEMIENQIVLTTRGVCRNVSFKNQHVKVECHKMAGAPTADSSNQTQKEEDGCEKS